MPSATITSGGKDWIVVHFDYDVDLKDDLMEAVGRGNYRWVAGMKAWQYRRRFHRTVVGILQDYEYDVDDDGDYQTFTYTPPPRASTIAANPWITVFASMDDVLARKLYRAVVQVVHPDKGGSTEIMQAVNSAWEKTHD